MCTEVHSGLSYETTKIAEKQFRTALSAAEYFKRQRAQLAPRSNMASGSRDINHRAHTSISHRKHVTINLRDASPDHITDIDSCVLLSALSPFFNRRKNWQAITADDNRLLIALFFRVPVGRRGSGICYATRGRSVGGWRCQHAIKG